MTVWTVTGRRATEPESAALPVTDAHGDYRTFNRTEAEQLRDDYERRFGVEGFVYEVVEVGQ